MEYYRGRVKLTAKLKTPPVAKLITFISPGETPHVPIRNVPKYDLCSPIIFVMTRGKVLADPLTGNKRISCKGRRLCSLSFAQRESRPKVTGGHLLVDVAVTLAGWAGGTGTPGPL